MYIVQMVHTHTHMFKRWITFVLQAKFCSNVGKSRELWNGIMQQGFGNQAQMWLEYFNLERYSYRRCKHRKAQATFSSHIFHSMRKMCV